jgi:hypothetical protein
MVNEKVAYRSYLLRLWREEIDHEAIWRSSLESAQTGERFYFASIRDLILFLLQQTSSSEAASYDLANRD